MKQKNKPQKRGGSVRIIAGIWRGRKIKFSENLLLRPTPSRIRETLFNWLMPVIKDATCLDLFAGSGILSFEALSRGAKEVFAIEYQKDIASYINKNIDLLEAKNLKVINDDAIFWLKNCKQKFDVIFLDPPYNQPNILLKCLNLIVQNNLLKENSYIYFESNINLETQFQKTDIVQNQEENVFQNLKIIKAKKAGNVYYYLAMVAK